MTNNLLMENNFQFIYFTYTHTHYLIMTNTGSFFFYCRSKISLYIYMQIHKKKIIIYVNNLTSAEQAMNYKSLYVYYVMYNLLTCEIETISYKEMNHELLKLN